jgi:isocitrate dehydrogenase (NAD+)
MSAQKIPATLIPGDGIGPEIMEAALAALEAVGAPFEWEEMPAGMGALKSEGDPLPGKTLDSIRRTRLALKGPLETPVGGGFRSINVRLREEFKLYANIRSGAHADSGWPLRQHRPHRLPREPRRPVHGLRALHPDRG